MATDSENVKSITLKPDWKQYFIPYLLSVLAVPLFGVGLIALFFVRKKHQNLKFEVTDSRITAVGSGDRRHIDLLDIEEIELRQNWLQQKLQIGTLLLKTAALGVELPGMRQPRQLKATIEQAVAIQRKQAGTQSFRQRPDPDYKPGSMEQMDYLTGLWQQGLLSDDDFENEKKNFE